MSSVGTEFIPGENPPVGIAYIALPTDIDRLKYIALCYKTSTVCIRTDDGAFYTRVPISDRDLQDLDFPEESKALGTPVVFVNEEKKNQLIIVATLTWSDNLPDLKQGQFRSRKMVGNTFVEIGGSAKEKRIGIIINTDSEGEALISILSKNNNGKFTVEIQGDANILVSNKISLESSRGTTISTITKTNTSSFTQTDTENKFISKKFIINKGNEAMMLGNETTSLLNKLITTISKATVMVNGTPMPLLNATEILQFTSETQKLLSKSAFLE